MITRKDYMDGKASFADYYGEIAKEAGISYVRSPMLPRIKSALALGDEHLNTIPIHQWDSVGIWAREVLAKLFKARGDCWSLAGSVCVHKQAAINAARCFMCGAIIETKASYFKERRPVCSQVCAAAPKGGK